MISILRKLPISLLLLKPLSTFMMDSSPPPSNILAGSHRLLTLAQQLRLYKPPPSSSSSSSVDDFEEQHIQETAGKVVSQVGFQESATSIANKDPQKFRPKRAAVLICLFEDDGGDLRVILTRRSSRLSTHSGEVSLPGGKADEGDKDDGETATREAKEEIGLDPSLVNVVTVLEPFLSKVFVKFELKLNKAQLVSFNKLKFTDSKCGPVDFLNVFNNITVCYIPVLLQHLLRVVPVIGILGNKKAFTPTPNPAEVEAVFDAPLEMFIKDENRRVEEREWMGEKYLLHFFDYEMENNKYLIWGLTAGILIRAASVVYQRPPAFLEQNPKFKFPRVVDRDTVMQ